MKPSETDELIKDFRQKRKEYEAFENNPKILKQLTVKDRLAVCEMASSIALQRIKALERTATGLYILFVIFGLYLLIEGIIGLWHL